MTLKEAIERLQIMVDSREKRGYHHESDALKLGIEALKRLRDHRNDFPIRPEVPLIGETED